MVAIPVDGRITSLTTLDGPLVGTEQLYIVSPGNAQQGNSYNVLLNTIAAFAANFPAINTAIVESGATIGDPYVVLPTDTRVLFNKTLGAPSYALLPVASAMVFIGGVLIKDLKGDADVNPITVSFSNGELCDGLPEVSITSAFGWFWLNPTPTGGAWYLS